MNDGEWFPKAGATYERLPMVTLRGMMNKPSEERTFRATRVDPVVALRDE